MSLRVYAAAGAEEALGDALEPFIESICEAIEDNARRIVPVDTHALQNSLYHEIERRRGGVVAGAVGSDLEYEPAVELGRTDINYPAQPFLKPALYQTRGVRP